MNCTGKMWLAGLLLTLVVVSPRLRAMPQASASLPSYQKASGAPLSTANPFDLSGPSTGGSLPPCPHVCLLVSYGESAQDAITQFEQSNHCSVGSASGGRDDNEACTEKWREDESFLGDSEGALVTKGYVPKYSRDIKDKGGKVIHKRGDVIGASGVTISTGVDLGQQSKSGTRSLIDKYVADKGNTDNVDVDALMKKLNPYFGQKKKNAVDALTKTPLTVTDAEADLLAKAFGYSTQTRVATKFDKNNTKGMVFQKLPEEAQTVIIDFAYQYGLSTTKGSIRKKFWGYVLAGDWKDLATWLKSKPDQYNSRRKREGDRLQAALDNNGLPDSGDPCAPVADTGAGDGSMASP